ncbi:MAG: NUDIX hydrolase [Actinomycetota bacterium]
MTAAGCFVTNDAGEVLLVRTVGRSWECPGGKVDEGETPMDAMHREVLEESGCTVEVDALVGIYVNRTRGGLLIFLFRGRHLDGVPTPSEETPEVGWFSRDRARELVPAGPHAMRLADALDASDRPVYREYQVDPFAVVSSSEL